MEPYWTPDEQPRFLSRTSVVYCRVPLKGTLEARGITNRLLESLLAYLPEGAYVAGGFMTSVMAEDSNASDIDIFFNSAKSFMQTMELLDNPPEDSEAWAFQGYKLDTDAEALAKRSGGLRFVRYVHEKRPPIQLIKLVWYESAEHVIDSFDFTVAQFASDGDELIFNPLSVIDLARKRLVLHRMQFPASTLRRLVKYTKKGYYACPGSLVTISEASAEALRHGPAEDGLNYVYLD